MSIGAVGSNTQLATSLQAAGLSSDKIKLVETDLQQAQQSSTASGSSGVDSKAVRATLDKQISADVASGKLSQDDADKIGKALDQMDGTTTASGGAGGAGKAGGPPGGGGGGGGGSTEKTEQSRTVTVAGGVKTTVITYTDGSTETQTAVDFSDADTSSAAKAKKADEPSKTDDAARAGKSGKSGGSSETAASDDKAVQEYLSKIEPGSLFDAYA
ncbi:MAG TPA: hypothetical protein VF503_27255 [Sphingobium sp.]|uniref:hypothetical protein n=1 Tax=Sphingobium sp. TaxID=1912891 RepID=UPI002ECFDE87